MTESSPVAGRRAGARGAAPAGGAKAAGAIDAGAASSWPPGGAMDEDLKRALRKAGRHVVPLGMAINFISNIDRSNLAYAALTLNRDNGFGPSIYSTAVSLFFVTYCVLQMPSNLVMLYVGHRPWLSLMVAGWGVVASCFALVRYAWALYLLRLLLGILEAGALPALWHVFAVFFPAQRVTVPFATLSVSILLANMVASPLATGLLAMDGLGGLKGWQWLFLLEGLPAVAIGIITWFRLPDSVATAKFLAPREREVLAAAVEADSATTRAGSRAVPVFKAALSNPYAWVAVFASMCSSIAAQVFMSFTPIIVSNILNGTALNNSASVAAAAGSRGLKPVALSAIPFALAAAASLAVGFHSERRNEQFLHVAFLIAGSGALLMLLPLALKAGAAAGFAALSVSLMLGAASHPCMVVLASRLCLGDEQAAVLPLVNSAVVLGGIVGPLVTGAMLNRLGGFTYTFVVMGALDVLEAVIILALRAWVTREGGLPDSGRNERNARVQRRRAAEAASRPANGRQPCGFFPLCAAVRPSYSLPPSLLICSSRGFRRTQKPLPGVRPPPPARHRAAGRP
ncbi:MAG: major facilitator superfamily domain-containing protein [Monoraphidium minutum]|nr:MAG: major facilitator superfamily domain-containing protein [Monoraphidium minutum]